MGTRLVTVGLVLQTLAFGMLTAYLLMRVNKTQNVCSVKGIGYVRTISYGTFTWASMVSLCASLLEAPQESWIPFGVMLAGLPVVALAGYCRFFYGNKASSFIELYATYEERKEKRLWWDYKEEMESSISSEDTKQSEQDVDLSTKEDEQKTAGSA